MIENIKEFVEYPQKGILSKEIVKSDKLDVALFCLARGTAISEHTSTKQGFVYVVEGKGTFSLEGQEISMTPRVFIYMKANSVHSLKAEANISFILALVGT